MREELVALLKTASRLCSDRGNSSSTVTAGRGSGGIPGEELALCSELTSLVRTALGSPGPFPTAAPSSVTSAPHLHHSPNEYPLQLSGYFDNGSYYNGSWNGSLSDLDQPYYGNFVMAMLSVVLGIVILITVIGNVFVIAAILLERNLQNVANYLIVSLAVADLMVACLVMPLGAVYEISQGWILGPELCDMWTSSDVLCCTASILHLVAIAVDRYWAVTNVDYIHTRNGTRIVAMIVVVWSVALVVSLAPQFGWKDPDYLDRINLQQRCLVSQDLGYQIFATCSTFYVPLLVILVLYWKIFQTARKRIRRRRTKPSQMSGETKLKSTGRFKFLSKKRLMGDWEKNKGDVALVEGSFADCDTEKGGSDGGGGSGDGGGGKSATNSAALNEGGGGNSDGTGSNNIDGEGGGGGGATTAFTIDTNHGVVEAVKLQVSPDRSTAEIVNNSKATTVLATVVKHHHKREGKKESIEAKRERKAAKTLAIITGAFVVCWLPFFIMALLMPLCQSCYINDYLSSLFLWLGYFNSTLNPVIYTIFSPEFRQAFKRMLCGVSHKRPRKMR